MKFFLKFIKMLDIKYEPAAQIVTLKVDSDISTRPEPLEDSNSGESKNSPGCIECRKDLSVKTLMRPFVKTFFVPGNVQPLVTFENVNFCCFDSFLQFC